MKYEGYLTDQATTLLTHIFSIHSAEII